MLHHLFPLLLAHVLSVHTAPPLHHVLPLLMVGSLGLGVDYRPKAIETILNALKPNSSQPEAIPWVMYDTQLYAQAGSQALSFFTTLPAPADKTITNMPIAGALPNPWYFEIQKVYFDALTGYTTNAATGGAASDIDILLKTGRGIASFNLSDKTYGPFPLTFFGGSGGTQAMISSTVATVSQQTANVRDNGGFPQNGSLIIPPQTQFSWVLNWVAASAISVATEVRMSMLGILYRRVS
jgi:hypothetical protein